MSSGRRRKLTPFLCQEMLFEYATDALDSERKTAVEEFLKTDKECREILEGINKALRYAETLSQVEPSTDVISHLKDSENVISLGRKYSSWKEWPDVMRWAVVCILLVISVAGVVSAVPWKRLKTLSQSRSSDTIEIAAIQTPNPLQVFANGESNPNDAAPIETSGDEEMEESGDVAGDEGGVPVPTAQAPIPQPAILQPSVPALIPKTLATPIPIAVVQSSAEKKDDTKGNGFVYRAFMTLPNLDDLGTKISSDIEQMGGTKAGDVELGWKRGTGRYYHFAVPEANQEKLLERLRAYGPVRISKDPHPRVMPQGQVRFILWVESGS